MPDCAHAAKEARLESGPVTHPNKGVKMKTIQAPRILAAIVAAAAFSVASVASPPSRTTPRLPK